ncbi:serine/threonine-protein kinase pim-3-like isoform X2 [Danio rerio]|uniref:Serine/threonine-protein kinase pim-3-like isoform X2 n=1 Tax=Danio rerio TaxID=7955 RepID=A0AC58IXT6_DANRE
MLGTISYTTSKWPTYKQAHFMGRSEDGQGELPLEVALMTRITSAPGSPSVLQLLDWFDHPRRYVLILECPAPCQDLQSFCEENGCLDEHLAKKVLVLRRPAPEHQAREPADLHIVPGHQATGLLLWSSAEALGLQILCRHRYNATPPTVWSIGVTLYNILCDCFPFRGAQRVTSRSRLTFPRGLSTE